MLLALTGVTDNLSCVISEGGAGFITTETGEKSKKEKENNEHKIFN